MGFNKLFLPEVKALKEQLANIGEEQFGDHWLRRLQKADAIIGPDKAHDFIKPFVDFAYNRSNNISVENEYISDIKK